jgi:signal recognition particle GTPase
MKMIEINVVVPKQLKIIVPQRLFEELEQMVTAENLSAIITEALTEELKKMRFRADLQKVSGKISTKVA